MFEGQKAWSNPGEGPTEVGKTVEPTKALTKHVKGYGGHERGARKRLPQPRRARMRRDT